MIATIALCAILIVIVRWRGASPFVFLTSDAANIASYAASIDHPNLFVGDALLEDSRNIRFYATVHIPVIRFLGQWIGDYGTAFPFLMAPHLFVQATGFYLLGRVLLRSRFWAALLAATSMVTFQWTLDNWGPHVDPTPRVSFQSLLPFLLAGCYYWRRVPKRWPLMFVGCGALMYVHPVSTPSWALALWLGFIPFLPRTWSSVRKCGFMVLLGFVFLLVVSPFMFNYFTSRAYGSTTADYDQVFSVMVERYAAGFLDIPRAMRDFIVSATKVGILPLSVVACIVLHAIARPPAPNIIMLDLWVIGLLAASAGIPFVEQMACRSYRVVPFEIDLIRNIRYLIPCMEIYCLLALAALPAYFKGRATRIVPAALGLAAFALWGFVNLGEYVRAASTGQMKRQYRSGSEQADWLSMLLEVRTSTPARSRILPIGDVDALPIRYFALRPVVYCWKDGGSFGYSNHAALLRWKEVEERVRQIEQQASPIELLLTARKLAGDLSADYVLIKMQLADVKEASPSVAGLELAVSTETFSLLKVRSPGRDADGSESWARRRTRLRDALRDVYRFPREQVELSPLIHRKLEGDGYHVESITFRSECNSRVTALLYVPADGEGPFPAIVVACGHGGSKSSLYAQYAGQLYAKLGFVCLVPDTLGEEERNSRGQMGTREHDEIGALKLPPEDRRRLKRMVFGKIVWDLIRGFDYLETRPEVDPSRLGIVGYSLGGAAAGSAATIDERIRAAVISSWAFRQRNATYGKYCTRLPYEAISKLMGFDEMTALVAPHAATLFMCGEHDTILDPDEGGAAVVRDLATNIGSARRRIFIAGCSTPIELSVQEGAGHRPYFLSHGAVDWMQRHLVEPLNRREIPVRRLSFGQWAKAMGQRIEPRYDKAERERGLQIVDIGAIYHDPVDLACFPARNLPVDEYTMKGWIDAALQRVPNP